MSAALAPFTASDVIGAVNAYREKYGDEPAYLVIDAETWRELRQAWHSMIVTHEAVRFQIFGVTVVAIPSDLPFLKVVGHPDTEARR